MRGDPGLDILLKPRDAALDIRAGAGKAFS